MMAQCRDEEIDRVLEICDRLLQIAAVQRSVIIADDTDVDSLLGMIDEREKLLSSIDIDVLRQTTRHSVDEDGVGGKKLRILAKLQELMRMDQENTRVLQARVAEARALLAELGSGRQALGTYAYLKPQTEAIFIDKRR